MCVVAPQIIESFEPGKMSLCFCYHFADRQPLRRSRAQFLELLRLTIDPVHHREVLRIRTQDCHCCQWVSLLHQGYNAEMERLSALNESKVWKVIVVNSTVF
ncbi:hypothetical protein B1R94_20870 [Mycolicibacterium litorale]|nr:hypothetical protein B1R94_20870 [Mycolicibacterium litorale]